MTNGKWVRLLAAHVAAAFFCVQLLHAADPSVRIVALNGSGPTGIKYGPNLGANIYFSDFSLPTINAQGKVVFKSNLTGTLSLNGSGIWSSEGGALSTVARTGTSGPGPNVGSNITFSALFDPLIDDGGNVVFEGVLTGSGISATNNSGIWSNASGALAPIFRTGPTGPGPDVGAGITFSSITYQSTLPIRVGPSGQVLTAGQIAGSGIDATNDVGLWLAQNGTRTNVARSGTGHAAGPNLGTGISYLGVGIPAAINSGGDITLGASLSGPGIDSTNAAAFIKISSGNRQVIARTGAAGPGPNVGAGVYFSGFTLDEHAGPSSSNELVFGAFLTGPGISASNDTGIWASKNGALRTVAQEGTDGEFGPGLGPGVYFDHMISSSARPIINAAGNVAVRASLIGNGITITNGEGIWVESNSVLQLIARRSNADPSGLSSFGAFSDPSMNALGQVAFLANLNNRNKALYLWHDNLLTEVVRTGTQFDINPDPLIQDLRLVTDILFAGDTASFFSQVSQSGGDDGRGAGLSDDGTLAFRLKFSNGFPAGDLVTDGIFTAHPVPEPSSLVLVGFGSLTFAVRARRRVV